MYVQEFIEPNQPETDPKRRYLCRHVFTEGHRCGSPALRGQSLCYYHGRSRREAGSSGNTHCFSMPRIDDRAAIQLALYEVLSRVSGGDIEYKRGSVLLYGLQIASANLPRPSQLKVEQPQQVEEVTADYQLGDLAPIVEIPEPAEAPGAGAPGSTASSSPLGLHPTATATPTQPYEREHTEEEKHFLDTATSTELTLAAVQAVACNQQPATDSDPPVPLPQDSKKPTSLRARISRLPSERLFAKGTDFPAAERPVSEIGRDFSPGITGAESMPALAPATRFPRCSHRKPTFSAACLSVPKRWIIVATSAAEVIARGSPAFTPANPACAPNRPPATWS